jgi:serine/threonine protein phosphatase 1
MATIAIGDVHGNRLALDDLLSRLEPEIERSDTVVFLGDYVDRGPDSKGCIDSILRFRDRSPATVVTLTGNHEDWLLRTFDDPQRHSWLTAMEGFATVASYSAAAAEVLLRAAEEAGPRLVLERLALPYDVFFNAMPAEHLAFLHELQVFHRTPDAVCVHGGLDPRGGPVESQPHQTIIWGTDGFPTEYDGPDTIVYGHWDDSQIDATGRPQPAIGRATIGIDTISHGVLTAIRLPDRRVFRSNRFA